jgi:dimethylhistidine N-methyltransferase
MMPSNAAARVEPLPVHDLHPEPDDMLSEVLNGLSSMPKSLPCKYFYDRRGSRLFDRICQLDEYYLTRTEIGILEETAEKIAAGIGEGHWVVELGSGSSTKTRILLEALSAPAGYVPIDISREHLVEAAGRICERFPEIAVRPVCADFNADFSLPADVEEESSGRRVLFFPGSTIGNFGPEARLALLQRLRHFCGPGGGQLLIGIDLIKHSKRLEAAYNDAAGVTGAFNLNLLSRINRELGADFELDCFEHRAFFDREGERIEMHLVSTEDQQTRIDGHTFEFASGESICTEHSYKFSVDGFAQLAARADWQLEASWTDADALFAILLLRCGATS